MLPCDVADHAGGRGSGRGSRERNSARSTSGSMSPLPACWRGSSIWSMADYERVTEVTYLGQVNGTRAALNAWCRAIRARWCWSASALAYRGMPLQSAYCGAKHAIQGFHDSIRAELFHAKTQGSRLDGPAAGRQHAAVRLDQDQHADAAQARQPALSAGSDRRSDPLGGASPRASRSWLGLPDDAGDLG